MFKAKNKQLVNKFGNFAIDNCQYQELAEGKLNIDQAQLAQEDLRRFYNK